MKFNIDNYKGKYVMHCETKEEAKDFCNYLHGLGREWRDGDSYADETNWFRYMKHTVYYFNEGTFSDCAYAEYENHIILEWSDFMNHTFTKADLKTGDVILRRNGDVEIVIKEVNVLVRPKECNRLADINEDLTHSFITNGDIIAVRRPKIPTDCQFSAFKEGRGTLIYDRETEEKEKVEEMTLAQVCKLLGKNIKIIQ